MEKLFYEGKIILLVGWWVLVVGEAGIKTLHGGHTDFMNQHIKYKKNTKKTGWCDILTHPVKYKRISYQIKTYSVLSSGP